MTMGQEVVNKATWGLAWRVGTGAGLSMLDLASDVYVVAGYLNTEGQRGFALSLLGMIGLSSQRSLAVWAADG